MTYLAQWVSQPFVSVLAVDTLDQELQLPVLEINKIKTQVLVPNRADILRGNNRPVPQLQQAVRALEEAQLRAAAAALDVHARPAPRVANAPAVAVEQNISIPYILLLLDRTTGKVKLRQKLQVQGRPLQLNQTLMLDNALVLGDNHVTIILPGAMAGNTE
jgi:hypothetical protein